MFKINENWNYTGETDGEKKPEHSVNKDNKTDSILKSAVGNEAFNDIIGSIFGMRLNKNTEKGAKRFHFAIHELGLTSVKNGKRGLTIGLQVSKSAPFKQYSGINSDIFVKHSLVLCDLFTRDIVMSDGSEGYEYGLQTVDFDDGITVEDAIREYMLNRGFIEIVPAIPDIADAIANTRHRNEIASALKDLKGILVKAVKDTETAEPPTTRKTKNGSLVSRLMK